MKTFTTTRKTITSALLSLLSFLMLTGQQTTPALESAKFSYSPSGDPKNISFFFEGDYLNVSQYIWDFGDTVKDTVTFETANHLYQEKGSYNVCLTIEDINGDKDTYCQTITVQDSGTISGVIQPHMVDFDTNIVDTYGGIKLVPQFPDSADLSYFWDFGDGFTSTKRQPFHRYKYRDTYKMTLALKDESTGKIYHKEKWINVANPTYVADFKFVNKGDTVDFINNSTVNLSNYFWSFGDGSISFEEQPMHVYKNPGIYTVYLVAWDGTGYVKYSKKRVRIGIVKCNSYFNYYADSLNNNVYFKQNALSKNSKFMWIFGDGDISYKPNPVHNFKKQGFYKVSLYTYDPNANCMDKYTEPVIVGSIGEDFNVDFNYIRDKSGTGRNLVFMSTSIYDTITRYIWDFGDGTIYDYNDDTIPAQSYSYDNKGIYNACLTIFSDTLQATTCKKVRVDPPAAESCMADFIFWVDSSTNQAQFLNKSTGLGLSYEWDFDGLGTSSQENPQFTFPDTSIYRVTLKISNGLNCESKHYELVKVNKKQKGIVTEYGFDINDTSKTKTTGYPVDFVAITHGDATKLKWSFGDGEYDSTNTNPTHTYETDTIPYTYTACLDVWDQITGEHDQYCEDVTVGASSDIDVLQQINTGGFIIYPNPASTQTTIQYELSQPANIQIEIISMNGSWVKQLLNTYKSAGDHTLLLNTAELSSGGYLIRYKANGAEISKPLIIQ